MATDIASHAALMGVTVELFETVGWAEELLDAATAADVRRLPRLYTAAGFACFVGRAPSAVANAHRATELEKRTGYEPCEPGYATFVEALGQVYCGHLDRYVELTSTLVALPGPARAYGIAAYVDGLQSAGRVEEALSLTEQAVAAAREVGSPYWIAYTLWIVGLAFSKADAQRALSAWDEGVEFVGEHRIRFFDGFMARDAARLHTSDGELDAALDLFGSAIEAFSRAGNVAQLVITLASVPALFERLDRLEVAATLLGAMSREPAKLCTTCPSWAISVAGSARDWAWRCRRSSRSRGAELDLSAAAGYARDQIELARRERAPAGGPRASLGADPTRGAGAARSSPMAPPHARSPTQLFISSKTADHHIQHIYTKIGVSNRATATRWALEHAVVRSNGTG